MKQMKICIVGAGSIGGMLGVRFHQAGEDVTLIARGPHLQAIKQNGLALEMADGTREVATGVKATSELSEVGTQDLVVLGVKAHQIAPIVDDLQHLIGPDTVVMSTQNGVPWWYFQKLPGDFENEIVETVDPGGQIAKGIDPDRLLGCIAYPAAEISEPGVIRHIEGMRFPVGELDGSTTARAEAVVELMTRAGFKSYVLDDIRSEIWLKLWGNLSFNPISALTHSTLQDICQFPLTRELAASMMTEAQQIAERLGAHFRVPLEKRIDGAEKVGKHKTSMLQDLESGKSLEIEAIIGAVKELGELTGIATPTISAVYALVRLLDHTCQSEQSFLRTQPLESASANTGATSQAPDLKAAASA